MGVQDPDDRPLAAEAPAKFEVIAELRVGPRATVSDATAPPVQSVVKTVPQPQSVSKAAPAPATDLPVEPNTETLRWC